jgi:pimeloyl-ACP methyl ester carboxylesterase
MSTVQLTSSGKIKTNGLNLYCETFGNPADPAILLIMGLATPGWHWFPYFYEPLVQAGYYVIRFDSRDVGLSDWIDPADWLANPYTLEDLAQDAIGLLDTLGIAHAHIIGTSVGAAVAQRIAISHPRYIRTLSSLLSSGAASDLNFSPDILPQHDRFQTPSIDIFLHFWRSMAGTRFLFDEQRYRDLYHECFVVRKCYNPHCLTQQFTAVLRSGSRLSELDQISVPTLVVHGEVDPLITEAAALSYFQQIPQATYLALPGIGHEIPEGVAPTLLTAIFNLFSQVPNYAR